MKYLPTILILFCIFFVGNDIHATTDDHLIAYYNFEEGFLDMSGNNTLLKASNVEIINNAMYLNGVYKYASYSEVEGYEAEIPIYSHDLHSITIYMDFYPISTTRSKDSYVIIKGDKPRQFGLKCEYNKLVFTFDNGEFAYTFQNTDIELAKWHNVILSLDLGNNNISIVLDKQKLEPISLDSSINIANGIESKYITFANYGDGTTFNGYIDNLMIFKHALSESEVEDLIQTQDVCFSRNDLDVQYKAGMQYCIDNPRKCNIPVNSYKNGYQAGIIYCINNPDECESLYDKNVQIENIDDFLEQCPTQDPAFGKIKEDFKIRRNGELVEDFYCTEPISRIRITDYSDELILLQTLRTIYYMDYGRSNHLPWTSKTLYDWMKSKINGIELSDTATYASCCKEYDDGLYVVLTTGDDFQRSSDRSWGGISGNIALLAHEVRHVDGYAHVACNGRGGRDQDYDENDLTAIGIQWWLYWAWLTGYIDVGYACLDDFRVDSITTSLMTSLNYVHRLRFCNIAPPEIIMPSNPGGICSLGEEYGTATLSSELDIHIPELIDHSKNIIWADFQFYKENNGELLWKLFKYGELD